MPGTPRPDQKLPRRRILRHRGLFEKAKRQGKRFVGSWLVLNALEEKTSGRMFAIIVPRAIGNAVMRNRVKRLAREVYRRMQNELPEDLISIWIARYGAGERGYHDFQKEITRLYTKARLLPSSLKNN